MAVVLTMLLCLCIIFAIVEIFLFGMRLFFKLAFTFPLITLMVLLLIIVF